MLVEARSLTKRFGDFVAVDGIDFDVRRGEVFGFLGPNGAGKSSTMRMIACVSPLTEGTLRVLDLDPVADGPRIRGRLGVVPQEDNLDTRAQRLRQPRHLRPLLRHRQVGAARASGRAARLRAARRPGGEQGRSAVGRHEAPPDHRPRARQRTRPAAARRAHHRPRSPGASPGVGAALAPQAGRRDAGAHDALHGRGRAAVRPARDHGRRSHRRRGLAGRAGGATRHA